MTKDCLEWRSLEMKSGFFSTIRTKNINDNFEKHQRNRPSREDLRPKWYFACGGIGKELFILSWCSLVVPERWTLQSATGTNLCRSEGALLRLGEQKACSSATWPCSCTHCSFEFQEGARTGRHWTFTPTQRTAPTSHQVITISSGRWPTIWQVGNSRRWKKSN